MRGRAIGWMLLGLLAGACGREPDPASEAAPSPAPPPPPPLAAAPLPVAVHGCAGLTLAPACWRAQEPAPLVLWIEGEQPEGALEVLVDGAPVTEGVALDADAEGVRIEVYAPAAARRLELVHRDGRRFALALVRKPPAWVAAERELRDMLGAERPIPEIRARLVVLREGLGPVEAHRLGCFEAKLAFAARDFAFAIEAPWRLGRALTLDTDHACVDELHIEAAFDAMMREPSYTRAVQHLEAARAHPLDLRARVDADYSTGLLETRLGRLDEGEALLGRAARLARRIPLAVEYAAAVTARATTLAALGRFDEADALAREAEAALAPDDPYRAQVRSNGAWIRILWREDDPSLPDPSPELRELVARFERERDPLVDGARLNLAIAASQSGDLDEAARVLATLDRRALHTSEERVFWELVTARVAEARRDLAEARAHLERARLVAELGTDEGLALRARTARAELELRAGELGAARRELEQAERIEDRIALGIAPHAGRSTFSSARRRARARHVALLLALGDREDALCTVLGARARHLRSLRARGGPASAEVRQRQGKLLLQHDARRRALADEAARSWMLPADELAALRLRSARELEQLDALLAEAMALGEHEPPPWSCAGVRSPSATEARLTMHPTEDPDRWWWLFDRAGAIEVLELEHAGSDMDEPALRAVTALASAGRLEGLAALSVVPIGAASTVDFHALPPLHAVEVRYAVGLGRPAEPAPVAPSIAVLVGQSENLHQPRAEAAWVGETLARAGWPVLDPWTPRAEPPPTLLHYAGHGRHGGLTGWDSHILLTDGELGPAQIIAHASSPAVVVLGACDAGTTDPGVVDGGMSMASAFVIAGATLVIAPRRAVHDDDARALAEVLYADPPGPGDPGRLAAVLQDRLAAAQRREPRFLPWRAWVP